MTTPDIAALRELLEKATPGPWRVEEGSVITSTAEWPMEDGPSWHDWTEDKSRFVGETRTADGEGTCCAELIAAMRNALPDLLSTIEGQAAALERLDRFAQHENWELSHGHTDEQAEGEWQVHSVNGGVNDREWTLIGRGETPDDAIRQALGDAA